MREETGDIAWKKVLLVGVDTGEEKDFERSMEELKNLAQAACKEVAGIITQRLLTVNRALYIGSGKAVEVKDFAGECGAEEVIFDNALSPSQVRNLTDILELPVLDRTNLILDIFALRAQTREAKLQVEMAKLEYMLPRLVGLHEALSRQGGASGSMSSKGTGEKKLELDRRKIEHRISELKKELELVERSRQTQRKRRKDSQIPQVALVGYTNAGKSTILNRMVEKYGECPQKTVMEKDMLFATLETSVRSIDVDGRPFLLADTVGFIHKLPHGLVKAFRSTLEEVRNADLLVQVVDFSDENYKQQIEVTQKTLRELEAGDIPQILVYNKVDKCRLETELPQIRGDQIYISAKGNRGIEELAEMIQSRVYADNQDCRFLIPYDKGAVVSSLMENASVLEREYTERGILLHVNCSRQERAKYESYAL